MAIGIQNYINVDTSDLTKYPNGAIANDTGVGDGTPVNRNTYNDMHLTLDKLLRLASIVANNLPENETNGYQYISALNKLYGANAWVAGPALTIATFSGGSISAGTVAYNKYIIVGKTLHWQVRLRGYTIAGGPTIIVMNSPSASNYPNDGLKVPGCYNGINTLVIALNGPSGSGQIALTNTTGSFTNGTTNQDFDINIVAELP